MKYIYCGGAFAFDYLDPAYRARASEDYRAELLGDAELLLQKQDAVRINDRVSYIGPFYFESDGMVDRDIVSAELTMVRNCTDAFFLLDHGLCPGTVAELTVASMLGKQIHIYYVRRGDGEETESSLHTPCWYPIILSGLLCDTVSVTACESLADAKETIKSAVRAL